MYLEHPEYQVAVCSNYILLLVKLAISVLSLIVAYLGIKSSKFQDNSIISITCAPATFRVQSHCAFVHVQNNINF